MASPKRLSELLQQKQDPFVLELYLLEKGYKSKNLNSPNPNGIFHESSSSSKFLYKKKRTNRPFSSIARALYSKFASKTRVWRSKNARNEDRNDDKMEEKEEEGEEGDGFSSASCSTVFNSCSDSDLEEFSAKTDENFSTDEIFESATGRMQIGWRYTKESKQHTPASLLQQLHLLRALPVYNAREDAPPSTPAVVSRSKLTENAILSASLRELLLKSNPENCNHYHHQFINSKNTLQKKRQLLFDCVKEAVELHGRNQRRTQRKMKSLMGAEEIGRSICNNLRSWGRLLNGNGMNVKELVNFDLNLIEFEDEWDGDGVEREEIVRVIGDDIMDGAVNEMIIEMVDVLC